VVAHLLFVEHISALLLFDIFQFFKVHDGRVPPAFLDFLSVAEIDDKLGSGLVTP